jgi:deazaflavin-dependent oxidoreductase (nitroreductase family)
MAMHVSLYRLTRGRIGGSVRGLRLLLLTTTGRKSGKKRTIPLGYFEDKGAYVIIASYGGSEQNPAWFLNLKSNPQVTIEVMDRRMAAIAEPAGPEERNRLWARLMELAPGYGDYQKRTTREIPMVILRPWDKVDAEGKETVRSR